MVDRDLGSELFSPAGRRDPHSIYARLRREGRVHRMVDPFRRIPIWIVTRYADCLDVLKNPRLVKDLNKLPPGVEKRYFPLGDGGEVLRRSMLNADPPDHGRLRQRMQRVFSPAGMEVLRERVQAIADELIDRVAPRGQMDLIADYAFPLPVTVIAELLGVPAEHRDRFRRWSRAILDVTVAPADIQRARDAVRELTAYFREVLDARQGSPRRDLASVLGQADELSVDERLSMLFLLLVAGHETTVNLIGNGMLALFENPEERRRLAEQPALVAPAIEEMLRVESPAETSSFRFPLEDLEVAGTRIPAGEAVVAGILSANRDEAEFPDPHRFDAGRTPNRHLGFGFGIHFCLGAPLSRLEGAIAFPTLLRRLPNLRLAVPKEALPWSERFVLRGIQSMPVMF